MDDQYQYTRYLVPEDLVPVARAWAMQPENQAQFTECQLGDTTTWAVVIRVFVGGATDPNWDFRELTGLEPHIE